MGKYNTNYFFIKDDIKKALKTMYSNMGFGDKAFEGVAEFLAITVTEADQIETAVAGVKPLLTSFQGDVDQRVNQAVAKAKAPVQTGGEQQPPKTEEEPKQVDPNDPLAKLTQLVAGLATSVNNLVEKDKTQTLQSKWDALAKEKGVKNQTLINKWMPSSEDDFDNSISELVDFNKSLVIEESNAQSTGRPAASGANGATTKVDEKKGLAALDKYLESTKRDEKTT